MQDNQSFLLKYFFIFLLFSNCLEIQAKVVAPNYDFSLDALAVFTPGTPLKELEEKYGKGEIVNKQNEVETRKYYIAHIRYKFPVLVQIFEEKVLDSFSRLPSYFSHDLFLQGIINRLGKQQSFARKDGTALYSWEDKDKIKYSYEGACTITCFPIYYSMQFVEIPKGAQMVQPILLKMSSSKI